MRKMIMLLSIMMAVWECCVAVHAQIDCADGDCVYLPLIEKPAAPAPSPTTTPMSTVVAINATAFVPYTGATSVYLVGEVRNETNSNVAAVNISAVLRDASNRIVDYEMTYSAIDTLSPGLTSPFRIIFPNPPDWTSYELSVSWSATADAPIELQIRSSEIFFDNSNGYHVHGTVRNSTAAIRNSVRVFLTLYNRTGKVIGVADAYTNPSMLAPGQEVSFDVNTPFWAGEPDRSNITRFSIQAVGD